MLISDHERLSMYVHSLEIENLKAIRKTSISFSSILENIEHKNSNVTVLLGNNGTGKTTILSGIALSVLAPIIKSSGFFARHMVTFKESSGFVRASLICHQQDFTNQNNDVPKKDLEIRLDLKVRGRHTELNWNEAVASSKGILEALYEDNNPGFFLLGYGATRRVDRSEDASSREKSRSVRYQRVAGLFEDHYALVPIESWFSKLKGRRREQISELLDNLLPQELVFTGSRKTHFWFEHHGVEMPFEALSDGYRAYVGLVSDILYHLSEVTMKKLQDVKGTVLIDEIDLHLHPIWQREVIGRLSQNLSNLQFIVTTHSPIVAGSVPDNSLLVLHRQKEGQITATRPENSIFGLSADQILVSDYFGLETTRAEGPALELRKMSREAMEGQKSGDLDASIRYLQKVAAQENRPFDNLSEDARDDYLVPKTREGRGRLYKFIVRFANRVDDKSYNGMFASVVSIIFVVFFLGLMVAAFVEVLPTVTSVIKETIQQ